MNFTDFECAGGWFFMKALNPFTEIGLGIGSDSVYLCTLDQQPYVRHRNEGSFRDTKTRVQSSSITSFWSTFLPSSTSNVRSWDISTSDCAVLSHCALRTSWICGIGQRLLIICLYVLGKQCDNAREHIHALIDRSRTAYAITDHQTMIIPSQPHTPQLAIVSPSLSLRLSLLPLPLLKPPPAPLPESLPRPGIGWKYAFVPLLSSVIPASLLVALYLLSKSNGSM